VAEDDYKLIDLDQMEPSRVRRRLRQWSTEADAARALVQALQGHGCLQTARVREPRYETNVYPLYFYWRHGQRVRHRHVYDHVFRTLPTDRLLMPENELRAHVGHTVDSEVDILVEDIDYFAFIEAKEAEAGHKVKFEKKGGVHQLVSLYLQGRILQTMISKAFVLTSIGANNGETLEIKLTPTERALLQLVDENREVLAVVDLRWPPSAATTQVATRP
jgi:hypothetical protein